MSPKSSTMSKPFALPESTFYSDFFRLYLMSYFFGNILPRKAHNIKQSMPLGFWVIVTVSQIFLDFDDLDGVVHSQADSQKLLYCNLSWLDMFK